MDCAMVAPKDATGANGLMKKCRVCGDKALAFNFNGLSCESCKAFFRRNALRQEELACLQGGKCEIDMSTRKFCPRCRLDKCFSIGMKKELVMAREEKSLRRRKAKKNQQQDGVCENDDSGQENIGPVHSPSSSDQEKSEDEIHTFDFGTFEQERFDEVKRASTVFLHKPYCALKLTGEANLIQAFNLQETYIKKIIEFCKSIDSFHCLKASDQLSMVKGFFDESLTIRCAYHYDLEQDGFPVRSNEFAESALFVRLDIIFPPGKQENLDSYRKFMFSLHNEIESDKHIRDLLITIALFKPKDGVSCPEFVRYNYFAYCRLFLRYLESKYQDEHKAAQKYCKLMHFMDRMWHLKEMTHESYMDIDVGLIAHVLSEIYHLTPRPNNQKSVIVEAPSSSQNNKMDTN